MRSTIPPGRATPASVATAATFVFPAALAALHVNVLTVPERTKDLALLAPQLDTKDLFRKQNGIIKHAARSGSLPKFLE